MSTFNRILAALLVVQIILAAVVFWPQATPAGAGETAMFPDLSSDDIVSLTVQDGDGNEINLSKQTGSWVLASAGDYPVEVDRITTLLDKLTGLKSNRLVTQTSGSHKRLQVATDDFVRRIEFSTAAGDSHVFYLGSSPQASATHVRLDGQDEVYLATDLSSFDASVQASGYVDTLYFTVPTADVTAMTLQNASGEINFVKDAAGDWTLADLAEGETVNATAISSLVNRAAGVRLTTPLGRDSQPDYGLSAPAAVVILTASSGEGDSVQTQTHTLQVGAQSPDDQSYVVASSQSPYFVRVASYGVQDFVQKTRSDFLTQPTPEAPAAGENSGS